MELTELLSRGHALLETEIQKVLKERADQEAIDQARDEEYMAVIETTLRAFLPECVWRYIDHSEIVPAGRHFSPAIYLTAPNCAPIRVNLCLSETADGPLTGKISKIPLVVPTMHYDSDDGPVYLFETKYGSKETDSLPFALAMAECRAQEFNILADKYALEMDKRVKHYQKQEARRLAEEAAKSAEPTAEDRLRVVLTDLIFEVLDAAMAAREM